MQTETTSPSRTLTWRELLAIVAFLAVGLMLLLFILAGLSARETVHGPRCQNHLKQFGLIFKMYGYEDVLKRLPPVNGYESFGKAENAPGCLNVNDDFDLSPDMRLLYPEYASDLTVLLCPVQSAGEPSRWRRFNADEWAASAPAALGMVADDGSGTCAYVGLITNGDYSYTYLPWRIVSPGNTPAPGPLLTSEEIHSAGLAPPGPAAMAAMASRLRAAKSAEPLMSDQLLEQDIALTDEPVVVPGADALAAQANIQVLRRLRELGDEDGA